MDGRTATGVIPAEGAGAVAGAWIGRVNAGVMLAGRPGGGSGGGSGCGAGAAFGSGPTRNGAWGIFGQAELREKGLSSGSGGIDDITCGRVGQDYDARPRLRASTMARS